MVFKDQPLQVVAGNERGTLSDNKIHFRQDSRANEEKDSVHDATLYLLTHLKFTSPEAIFP